MNAATNFLYCIAVIPGYVLTHNMFLSVYLLSIVCAGISAFILLFIFADTKSKVITTGTLLCFSYTYCEGSSSGLENILLIMFIALILVCLKHSKFNLVVVLCNLLLLTRLDILLLTLPLLLYIISLKHSKLATILYVPVYLFPTVLFLILHTVYYGFPFPNTYYAKLYSGLPKHFYYCNGLVYCLISFLICPLFFIIILCLRKYTEYQIQNKTLCIGMVLYAIYIVSIGGDFILGRHYLCLYFISIYLLLQHTYNIRHLIYVALVQSILLVCYTHFDIGAYFGPHDEYTSYRNCVSFKHVLSNEYTQENFKRVDASRDLLMFTCGRCKYINNQKYLTDCFALGDPLLARLKVPNNHLENIRIGHIYRELPEGYYESVCTNTNMLRDHDLSMYYDKLCILTKSPIFIIDRFKTIVLFNLHKYDYLLHNYNTSIGRVNINEAKPVSANQIEIIAPEVFYLEAGTPYLILTDTKTRVWFYSSEGQFLDCIDIGDKYAGKCIPLNLRFVPKERLLIKLQTAYIRKYD